SSCSPEFCSLPRSTRERTAELDPEPGMESQPQRQYAEQLRQMMFGLGDLPEPCSGSLDLVEDFLRLRLSRWAAAAVAAHERRDGPHEAEVSAADLVAALRSNRRALAHCIRYHRLLAERRAACRLENGGDGAEEAAEIGGPELVEQLAEGADCDERSLPPFLESALPEAADALAQLQAEQQQRLQRLNRCSEGLSPADYARFARSRRCCLVGHGGGSASRSDLRRFRSWLGPAGHSLSSAACRLLSYLAHQAVAELLDTVKLRRAETWPSEALLLEAEVCASAAELREAMQLRAASAAR
ncbi:hypothetical protein BOX15_Mlig016985g3, partial [Macrostomum lignano]